jgi:3-oxoadipate enol-lactonase
MQAFHEHLRHVKGAALARAVRSVLIEREPLAPRMSAIHAPTLFVAGRYDTLYPMEPMASAARTLPNGRFEALDTAHISVVDAPDETTALIDAFLRTLA